MAAPDIEVVEQGERVLVESFGPQQLRGRLVRAEAPDAGGPMNFLQDARQQANGSDQVFILGPQPAPMERRAGRYRAQLLVQASDRHSLQNFLGPWLQKLEGLQSGRKVRWSVDVDPQDMY